MDQIAADPFGVMLAVSELVTNAVLHERNAVHIDISYLRTPGTIRIEVHPSGVVPGASPAARPDRLDGRGLAIVAAVCRRWGTTEGRRGPITWCEFEAG